MTRNRTPSDDLPLAIRHECDRLSPCLAGRQRWRRWRVSPAWAAVAVGLGMLVALWILEILP